VTAGASEHPGSAESPAAPWVAFGFCCAVWGSTFLFIRIGNDTMPPVWAAAVRLAIATLLFIAIALVRRTPWPRGAQLSAAIWFGVVDFGVSLPLLYWGEQRVPSGIAAVMYATIPLVASIFARLFGLEPLRPRVVIASIVAIGGVAILCSSNLTGQIDGWRMVAVALAAITAGLAGVLLKRAPGADPFATNAWAHGAGAILCCVASLMLHEAHAMPRGESWVSLVYLIVVGSIGAFGAFTWLVARWSVTRISFVAVVVPVVALVLGLAVRHEQPGRGALLGSLVILGAVIAGIAGERHARRPAPAKERATA
jgi:drug/metabolite transporter (DMT)-like permease